MEYLYPWKLFGHISKLWSKKPVVEDTDTSEILRNYKHYYGGETAVNSSAHAIAWDIKNFITLCPADCKSFPRLWSPTFDLKPNEDPRNISAKISLEGKDGSLSCYLYLERTTALSSDSEYSDRGVQAMFTTALGASENSDVLVIFQSSTPMAFNPGRGRAKFITIKDLHEKRGALLINGSLQVRATFTVFGEPTKSIMNYTAVARDATVPLQQALSRNMSQLLNDASTADVRVICEERVFAAHKSILGARSTVFKAMLESQMVEAASGEIILPDIDASNAEILLGYLYTGEVKNSELTSYLTLIHAAEKYELPELKEFSFQKLVERMSLENIGELAIASRVYGAGLEVRAAINRFSIRNLEGILKTPALKEVFQSNPKAFFD